MGQPSLVRDTAGSRILAAYERVRAYETIITWADVPTLHALRIEGKRLRYTLEYFAEVLPVARAQAHRRRHGDAGPPRPAATTRTWRRASVASGSTLNAPYLPAASREAVGLYLDSREADVERLRRSFRPLWRRMTGPTFRRALGLAITQIG